MKLSHQEIELLTPVLYRIIKRNYELDEIDKDLIALQKRLEQYHETTKQLERE